MADRLGKYRAELQVKYHYGNHCQDTVAHETEVVPMRTMVGNHVHITL